jgi:hypothetical protein
LLGVAASVLPLQPSHAFCMHAVAPIPDPDAPRLLRDLDGSILDEMLPGVLANGRFLVQKSFTVRGPALVSAMLKGKKRYEVRSCRWSPGWYFLHAGASRASKDHAAALVLEWPDAPPEDSLPFSAVYGLVKLGLPLSSRGVGKVNNHGTLLYHPLLYSRRLVYCTIIVPLVSISVPSVYIIVD